MKRIIVLGKHIMLASVLFAGLGMASCSDDFEKPSGAPTENTGSKADPYTPDPEKATEFTLTSVPAEAQQGSLVVIEGANLDKVKYLKLGSSFVQDFKVENGKLQFIASEYGEGLSLVFADVNGNGYTKLINVIEVTAQYEISDITPKLVEGTNRKVQVKGTGMDKITSIKVNNVALSKDKWTADASTLTLTIDKADEGTLEIVFADSNNIPETKNVTVERFVAAATDPQGEDLPINGADPEHGTVEVGTLLTGDLNKVDIKPEGVASGDRVAIFYEVAGENPTMSLRSVNLDLGLEGMMTDPFGLKYPEGQKFAPVKTRGWVVFTVTDEIEAAFNKSRNWGGPYLCVLGNDIKVVKAIKVKANWVQQPDEITKDLYFNWSAADPTVEPCEKKGEGYGEFHFGEAAGTAFGDGNVSELNYVDLSDYSTLEIVVSDGTPRPMFNRNIAGGQNPDHLINIPNDADQTAAYVISDDTKDDDGNTVFIYNVAKIIEDWGYCHLHCVKGANWANVTIMKIQARE